MNFYYIKDEYIDYLRQFDDKVLYNKNEKRPYVGIVFSLEGINYFAPFTSPKVKHKKMIDKIDFIKINNGDLGAINLNNMIPVNLESTILIKINLIENLKYRRLLQEQFFSINSISNKIKAYAFELRKIVFTNNDQLNYKQKRIKERCCNLVLLEKIYKDY